MQTEAFLKMKKALDFIKNACAYSVGMLSLLYIVALIMQFDDKGINFQKFALVIVFSLVISAGNLLFKIPSLGKIWATLLHYCVLLFSFTAIFTWSGVLGGSANIFSSFFIFTFFYFAVYAAVAVIKLLSHKNIKKQTKKTVFEETDKKSDYTPRFKEIDGE